MPLHLYLISGGVGLVVGFMLGVLFSTFWVFPRAVQFLLTLKSQHLVPMLSVEAYLKFFMLLE